MKKTLIRNISLSLACLLGFGVLTANLAVTSKENAPVNVDAATTTTATLTYSDVLAHARSDYKKTTWGDWEWWKVPKKDGEIYAGDNTYFVNSRAYTDGATKIDLSISFKDGYVVPRMEMIAETLATNSNSFSWTIIDDYYNYDPPKKVYFEDTTSGERHIIESFTITYTFTKYKITLNSNGGTGGLSSVQVPYNRAMPTISSANLPTRDGYVFQGYYDTSASTGGNQYYKANGTSARTFTNKNDSLVLYARWALAQKPVNITKGTGLSNVYVSSNGNVTSASSSDLKSSGTNFAQNSTVYGYVKLAAGYQAQSGWTLKAGTADTAGALYLVGSGTVSSSGYDFGTFNASVITYSIDYELNGGSVATANPTSYTIESDTFTLNNPTKEGYNFLGWSEDGKSGYAETVTITKGSTGNKSYTANWTLVQELQTVVDAINDLGGPTNISYPDSKTGLENAESLYSSLDPTLKSVLDTDYADLVNELIEDRNQYDSLRSAAIDNAIDKIDAISEPISYPGSRDEVFAARDALADLDESDRVDTVVTNLNDYNDALDTYNALKDIAVDQVIEAINNIVTDDEGKAIYPNSKPSLENAESLYEDLAPEEKYPSSTVSNYNDLVNARSDYNASRDDALNEVTNAIDAISKPFDDNREEQIATAQGLFDALDSSDKDGSVITNLDKLEDVKAADEVADLIEALPVVSDTEAFRTLVSEAREAYTNLSDEQKEFINEDILELLESREQALLVIDAINDIGDISYPESKSLLDTANDLYDEYIQAGYPAEFIVNYQTLVNDNTEFNNADEVATLIKAIPTPSDSDTYYDAVDIAQSAYISLSPAEQALLGNAVFDDSGITYAQYLVNQVAARDVIERIQDIGTVIYSGIEDSLEDIVYAESGYSQLSDEQKEIVNGVNYNTLIKDRADYDAVNGVATLIEAIPEAEASAAYYNAVDSAALAYAELSSDQLNIINAATEMDYEKILEDHIAAKAVISEIANIGDITYDGGVNDSLSKIVSAETNYGNLTGDQQAIVNSANYNTLTNDREVYDNVSSVADLIKAIPAASESEEYYNAVDTAIAAFYLLDEAEQNILKASIFDEETGITYYQYLFNHVAARDVIERIQDIGSVVYGGEDDSLEAIVYAETGYNALSDAQQAIVNGVNYNTLVHDREIYNHVDNVADLITAIIPAEGESYYDAVEEAAAAYADLTPEEQAIINNSVTADYEKILSDNLAASVVIEAIENIGELTYKGGVNDSLEDIELAEGLYELLSNDQKAIVIAVNYDELVAARASYDKVDSVVTLINAIGEVKNDEETKTQLEVARDAYDLLSQEEQELVNGYNNTYKTLEDDEHVYEALVKIDAIGEVSYDTRSEDAISEAREYYNSLSEDQKEQLGDEPFATLTNAESTYASKKQTATIIVIIFLIIACAAILAGIWFLVALIRRKKNKDDDNKGNGGSNKKEPVKVLSIGGILPGITLISHYVDAPYIALYVLIGLAVLLWISILVTFIMKKKQVGPFKKMEAVDKVAQEKVEEQSSISQEEEDEEVETISDEKGNIFQIRFIKSFTAKLIQSPEETKKYYEELKNEVLSYKKTTSRISWHFDSINSGRNQILKFAIRGKTLCVYLPLDVEKLDEKYKVEKSESKKYEDVSCLYRIKNDRRREYAKELIAMACSNLGLEKGEEQHEVYSNLPYEPNKPLVARGLIKEQMIQANKSQEPVVLESKLNADGDEVVVAKDESGDIFEIRYIKSFTAKLCQSEKEVKDYYTILKNYVLSYKDAHSRVSWHYDAINVGREYVLKFAIRGKTLCVYFALDASKLDEKYKVEDAKGKKYEEVPVLYRIKNDRRCEYAKELIDEVMKKLKVEQGEIPTENYSIPHESNKALLAKGLIKELKTASKKNEPRHVETIVESISVDEVDQMMSDEDAEVMIEEDKTSKAHKGKKAIINIDELEVNFNDGDKITLEVLQEKGLVAKDVGRVKLLARGRLDKKLHVDLQEYSLQAVKMILLVGGKVQKAK